MKKLFKRTTYISLTLVLLLALCSFSIKNVSASDYIEDKVTDVGGAKYRVKGIVEENILPEGVVQTKYVAECSSPFSGFSAAGSGGGGSNVPDQYYPQSVNILNIPSTGSTRIINWTYTSKTTTAEWTKATVVEMAKNFEQNNPGWKVIAAVNGDFFDINGNGNLPYQTTGVAVCDGEVIRPTSSGVSVGFKSDGSNKSYINSSDFTYSTYHVLTVYNELEEVVTTLDVKYINEMPSDNETAVYYSYPSSQTEYANPTLPSGGYVSVLADRMAPMSSNMVYAKGSVELAEESVSLSKGQFGIYTNNQELKEILKKAYKVRVQREITGTYAGCDNVSGGGDLLVSKGKGVYSNNITRHPRTMVGVKADGTIVFATVDGRQPSSDMYGMTNMEMSALMEYHGCVEANNMDGGGSTTMIIREGNGFRVMNSPSDKTERRDANALLVVIPSLSLELQDVSTDSFELTVPQVDKKISISDIVVEVDKKQFTAVDDKILVTGLEPGKEYEVNYKFNLTYKGKTTENNGTKFTVTTSKIIPTIKELKCSYIDGSYVVNYDIDDPQNAIDFIYFKFDKRSVDVKDQSLKTISYASENVDKITIYYAYNTGATNSSLVTASETLHKVVFDNNGETTEVFVRNNECVKKLKAENMEGYKFIGWYLNGEKFDFNTPITENIILFSEYAESTSNSCIGGIVLTNLYSLIALLALILIKRK